MVKVSSSLLLSLLIQLQVSLVQAFYHSLPQHRFYQVPSDLIKNVNPSAFLMLVNHTTHFNLFLIPDSGTAEAIGIAHSIEEHKKFPNESITFLKNMQLVKHIDPRSPDGVLEGILRRGELFSRVNVDWYNRSCLQYSFNGGLIRWQHKLFLSWRSGRFNSVMRFAWAEEDTLLQDEYTYTNKMGESLYHLPFVANWSDGSEDGRLHPHPTDPNKLGVTFTFYTGRFYGIPFTAYSEISLVPNVSIPSSSGNMNYVPALNFSDPVIMHIDGEYGSAHKNWMPFEYQHELYYVTHIYPFRVVKYEPPPPHNDTNEVFLHYLNESHIQEINHSAVITARHTFHAHNISHHLHPHQLHGHGGRHAVGNQSAHNHRNHAHLNHTTHPCLIPWDHTFGVHIRGGTPAMEISHNRYLAFFHSVREIWGMNTYFIGAFTFTATRPFRLLEMSRYPIAKFQYYDGKWLNKYVNYVLFPMSYMLDRNDSRYLWLSFGHQDSKSYIHKFKLDQILASLEPVINC